MKVESVPLSKLKFDKDNTNTHGEKNLKSIKGSLTKFGQVEPLVVNKKTSVVVGGNGRLQAMKEMGWKNADVHFLTLTPKQHKMLSITLNRSAELAKRDPEKLMETLLGLKDDFDLGELGWDDMDLKQLLGEDSGGSGGGEGGDSYSKKIVAPVYEPKGLKPTEAELCDRTKVDALVSEIKGSSVPVAVKDFLTHAAQRHAVFDYENIAEYYAHAPKEVQELMERSALVIIDFKKAIENGFVVLTEELAKAYKDDPGYERDDE